MLGRGHDMDMSPIYVMMTVADPESDAETSIFFVVTDKSSLQTVLK